MNYEHPCFLTETRRAIARHRYHRSGSIDRFKQADTESSGGI